MDGDRHDTILQQAIAAHMRGDTPAAEDGYQKILAADPRYGDALDGYAVLAFQTSRLQLAEEMASRAVEVDRRNPEYFLHHGLIAQALAQWTAAETSFRRAIKLSPQHAEAHFNLGMILIERGSADDGLRHIRRAVQLAPDNLDALNGLGLGLLKAERQTEAEEVFREVLSLSPHHIDARNNLVSLLNLLDQPVDAEKAARDGVALESSDPRRLELHARQLQLLERPAEALAIYEKIKAHGVASADVELAFGSTLLELGRLNDAIAHHEALLKQDIVPAHCHYNIGLSHKAAGRMTEAVSAFDRALKIRPDWAQARYTRALTRMALRDFKDGLSDYEARWDAWQNESTAPVFPHPLWQDQLRANGSLLVWAEQGVGDHLLYASLLHRLTDLGVTCTFECDRRLTELFERSIPGVNFIAAETPPAAALVDTPYDYQVAMGSLLFRLGLSADEILAPHKYLSADPERVAAFIERMDAHDGRPRVGISWRSTRQGLGPRKSIPLASWSPILTARDATFVNLQYGDTDEEIGAARAAHDVDIYTDPDLDRFNDLDGLVALIEGLDLVITTSNVTAHFAGALGKETLLLLQNSPLWYWGCEGDGTLFYPSVRAFRQQTPDAWDDVINGVGAYFKNWAPDPTP